MKVVLGIVPRLVMFVCVLIRLVVVWGRTCVIRICVSVSCVGLFDRVVSRRKRVFSMWVKVDRQGMVLVNWLVDFRLSRVRAVLCRALVVRYILLVSLGRAVRVVPVLLTILLTRCSVVLFRLTTPCLIRLTVRTLPAFLQTGATWMLCRHRVVFALLIQFTLLRIRMFTLVIW